MTSREFDLAAVLSIVTNVGLTDLQSIRKVVNFMVDRDLPGPMLSTGIRVCRAAILSEHKGLTGLKPPTGMNRKECELWVGAWRARVGSVATVKPVPPAVWEAAERKFFSENPQVIVVYRPKRK